MLTRNIFSHPFTFNPCMFLLVKYIFKIIHSLKVRFTERACFYPLVHSPDDKHGARLKLWTLSRCALWPLAGHCHALSPCLFLLQWLSWPWDPRGVYDVVRAVVLLFLEMPTAPSTGFSAMSLPPLSYPFLQPTVNLIVLCFWECRRMEPTVLWPAMGHC